MIRRLEVLKEVLSAPTSWKDAQKTVRLYPHVHSDIISNLEHGKIIFYGRKSCITIKVIKNCNGLLSEVVGSPSYPKVLKIWLDKTLNNQV